MKEVKFRVWDKDLKRMHVCGEDSPDSMGFSYQTNEAYYYNLQNGEGSNPDGTGAYELMQYTCLKDKNGVEIYEGDIVSFVGDRKGNRVVEYKNEEACFIARNLIGTGYLEPVYLNDVDFEVNGNIYEHPELLE